MLQHIYRIVLFALYSIAFPVLWVMALSGSRKWRNRLGRGFERAASSDSSGSADAKQLIWAHAASVGETLVLANFVRSYQQRNLQSRFIVTVMTESGYETGCDSLSDLIASGIVVVRFFPLDCPQAIRKALSHAQPDLFVFTETEIWPNWTAALIARKIPYVLLNARLTERSVRRYSQALSFVRSTMLNYQLVMCQSKEHVARFESLGVPQDRICVSGNMKSDAPMRRIPKERRDELRKQLGATDQDFLLVCGSIRSGEYVGALKAYQRLAGKFPKLKFALAPRHLDLSADIISEAQRRGIGTQVFSKTSNPRSSATSGGLIVTIIDVFGVLRELYGAADLAFVGGTMTPVGGHNVLEPPQVGTPVLFGPNTENVTEGVALTLKRNCGLQVADWEEFALQLERTLKGEIRFNQWDANPAEASSTEPLGPLQFTISKIEDLLEKLAGAT